MSSKYGTILTAQGAAIIADCILNGRKLPVKYAVAGDGGGAPTTPLPSQTALVNERWRGEIAGVKLSTTTPNMLDVKIVLAEDVGNFTVREMGLLSADGKTLISVCNTPDTEKIAISAGVSGELVMLYHLVVADASAVEIIINKSLDVLNRQDLEAALAVHNADPGAHGIRHRVISARSRDPNKPTYGLGGEDVAVLDMRPYTGTAPYSAVVSGTEYDALNLSVNGDTAPDGTIILKKVEE